MNALRILADPVTLAKRLVKVAMVLIIYLIRLPEFMAQDWADLRARGTPVVDRVPMLVISVSVAVIRYVTLTIGGKN